MRTFPSRLSRGLSDVPTPRGPTTFCRLAARHIPPRAPDPRTGWGVRRVRLTGGDGCVIERRCDCYTKIVRHVYRDVLDDVWTTARVICLNSHQLRDKTVGRIWKRPNTYRPARRRVFAKKSSPPPDCKKINVILLWATSRRNVVIGKYLPHPLVSRRRKARTGTGTRRGCGDRLFDLRGFRRKRGRSGPACWERRDGQFRRAHFASAVLCGIFEDSDWGANNWFLYTSDAADEGLGIERGGSRLL